MCLCLSLCVCVYVVLVLSLFLFLFICFSFFSVVVPSRRCVYPCVRMGRHDFSCEGVFSCWPTDRQTGRPKVLHIYAYESHVCMRCHGSCTSGTGSTALGEHTHACVHFQSLSHTHAHVHKYLLFSTHTQTNTQHSTAQHTRKHTHTHT